MSAYTSLKEAAYEANMELPRRGLVLYTFGNVSAYDEGKGAFAIKPSGVSYEDLRPKDMVVVSLDNTVIEGKFRPSSDTKTHAALYREFSGIGGIAHTHSTYAVAWAQAQRAIPIYGTTHADHAPGDIPCAAVMSDEAVKGDYEEETGKQIINALHGKSHHEYEMVLVAGHGPFTWGNDAAKAVYNSAVLEALAQMAFLTEQINGNALCLPQAICDKHYKRKHGKNAYYGQK